LTNKFSLICQIRDFGSGQILQPGQFCASPGFAKITPWRLVRRDNSLAKAPGQVIGRTDAANVYSLNRRAVIKNAAGSYLYSASRIASNKMHNNITVFQFLSAYIATRKCPAEFPLPTRV
jgi:hypothetical protein